MVRRSQRTANTRPSMFTRMRARAAGRRAGPTRTTYTTTTQPTYTNGHHTTAAHHGHHGTVAPVLHQRRRPSIGDKVSGALMKLRGSLTRRPGLKAAGTRRMHGTDGRGSHRAY